MFIYIGTTEPASPEPKIKNSEMILGPKPEPGFECAVITNDISPKMKFLY